jgi:CheY-like chemotaxis protein
VAPKIVLVIEDPDTLAMMRAILEGAHYAAIPCRPSRLDSRREIDYAHPDLILLDVPFNRPAFTVADAVSLASTLRADETSRDIPILVCSTDAQLLQRHRALREVLPSEFIAKPFEMADLLGRVARLVEPKAA